MTRARRSAFAAAAILALVLAPAAGAQQEVRFRVAQPFPVGGSNPEDMKIADLNGDTHRDIVVTNFDQGTITVLLGDGEGEFTPLPDMPAGSSPTQLAVADFDTDTDLDLIVSETESDHVTYLEANGDGTFAAPVQHESGHDSQAVTGADMNEDGNLDLVVTLAAEAGGRAEILLGDGNGNFAYDPTTGRNLSAGSFGVGVADFDRDTHLDVVATTIDGRVFLLPGDGEGGIGRDPAGSPTGATPAGLAVVDVDGDSRPDVLTADGADNTVSLLRNTGDAAFAPPVAFPVGTGPERVVAADLNADTHVDAVTANFFGDLSVLHGDGAGGFLPARNFAAPQFALAVAAADVTGDDVVDLLALVQENAQGAVLLMRGRPDGYEAVESVLSGRLLRDLVQGDLNGDGLPDLVASSRQFGIAYVPANPTGGFGAIEPIADRTDVDRIAVGDLDGNRRLDVVVLAAGNPDVLVVLARDDGSFATPAPFEIAGPGINLILDDFDADGILDIAATSTGPPAVSILFGNGDGTYPPRTVVTLDAVPAGLASGRFDDTAGADLAVSSLASSDIRLLLGRPDRSFDQTRAIASGSPRAALHTADFDGDGADDLAAGAGLGTVQVFYGTGQATFEPGQVQSAGSLPKALDARDVTGDGRADLLIADQIGNAVGIAPYLGSRQFGVLTAFAVGMNPETVEAGDFNGDGAYDVVGAGRSAFVLSNAVTGPRRGDGNGDGIISAADLVVLAGPLATRQRTAVEDATRGVPGATTGVDANGDGTVDRTDVARTLALVFTAP